MQTAIIEAEQPGSYQNWGKFMVMRFDRLEWQRKSRVSDTGWPLLREIGWGPYHIIVFDLQTCEGAGFWPGGSAHHDLNKHAIHVCVLFEAFLEWLYKQDLSDFSALPEHVEIECEFGIYGYRRPGIDLVGLTEIAEMRGFTKSRALQLTKDPDFPEPACELAMGRAWHRVEVELFFQRRYPAERTATDVAA